MEKSIFCVLCFILFANFQIISSQSLSCNYTIFNGYYSCELTINNPNGLNNFQSINGTHLDGRNDDHVQRTARVLGSSTNIPSIICSKFKNLREILLTLTGIQRIDEDSFSGCKNITYLSLYSNRISVVHENSFSENSELLTLILWNNQLTSLPENLFANLHKLVSLDMDSNELTNLPENLFTSLRRLTNLDLRNNKISSLNVKWFETLENLLNLILNTNQIEELPENAFDSLSNLYSIYLNSNKLKVIRSSSFGIHPRLNTFDVSNNQISAVDERFLDNANMTRFNILNNLCANINIFDNTTSRQYMRSNLSLCFENYQNLVGDSTTVRYTTTEPTTTTINSTPGQGLTCNYTLINAYYACQLTINNYNGLNNFQYINGTHLDGKNDDDVRRIARVMGGSTNIPSIICNKFKNLREILLTSTGIQRIDEDSFSGCKNITSLSLYNNEISVVHEKSFNENSKLLSLILRSNELTSWPENLFANLHNLVSLDMDSNGITNLPENLFKSLRRLINLDLQRNKIPSLNVKWFETLENLGSLYLQFNQIEELPEKVFNSLSNINLLSLFSNKLKVIHSSSFGIHPRLDTFDVSSNQISAVDERFIDNTNVTIFNILYNLCANINIFDNTTSRQDMRANLSLCFENYQNLHGDTTTTTTSTLPPGCIGGNLDERVCKLEDENMEFNEYFQELRDENQRLGSLTNELHQRVDTHDEYIAVLQENFDQQIKAFKASIDDLQNQILELTTNPCACR